jgi:hypothetical protein
MKTKTQYVTKKERAKKHLGSWLDPHSFPRGSDPLKVIAAHFEDVEIRSSFVHEIGNEALKKPRSDLSDFHRMCRGSIQKVGKRYRIKEKKAKHGRQSTGVNIGNIEVHRP